MRLFDASPWAGLTSPALEPPHGFPSRMAVAWRREAGSTWIADQRALRQLVPAIMSSWAKDELPLARFGSCETLCLFPHPPLPCSWFAHDLMRRFHEIYSRTLPASYGKARSVKTSCLAKAGRFLSLSNAKRPSRNLGFTKPCKCAKNAIRKRNAKSAQSSNTPLNSVARSC